MNPTKSSFELELFPKVTPSLKKPARREEQSAVPADHPIWHSESVAVCLMGPEGEVLRMNSKFLDSGVNAADLSTLSGAESIPAGENGETFWIFVPGRSVSDARETNHLAFRLLHDSVAQSVAALAMNLFLVKQSGATSTSPAAEKILRSSLDLVEQCAKEVRGICTLLQRQSKQAGRNCA